MILNWGHEHKVSPSLMGSYLISSYLEWLNVFAHWQEQLGFEILKLDKCDPRELGPGTW